MEKRIIFSIGAIIIILGVVFLSQQAKSRVAGETFISDAANQGKAYLADGAKWASGNVVPKITGGVQAKGETIKTAAVQQQKNISQNLGQQISNYFSGVANSILHPGIPQNCPAQTPALAK